MRALEFITGQVAYNQILQTEETHNDNQSTVQMKKWGHVFFISC